MPKNIVVFSDGTGQDGGVRPEQRMSNVYKLYRACRTGPESPIDPADQVAFYDAGLGTDAGATAMTAPVRFFQKLLGSVAGRGITANIAECYEFIINHYQPGDRIFLIGFSRGAYTVRALADLIRLCGIPTLDNGLSLARYRRRVRNIADEAVLDVLEHGAGQPREKFEDEREELARRFREKYACHHESGEARRSNAAPYFIGVFDTVAALGAKGARRRLIQLGLLTAISVAALVPSAIAGGFISSLSAFTYWPSFLACLTVSTIGGGLWLLSRQRQAVRKTISDFPNKGDKRQHLAEWKGDNFPRLLSRFVTFARSANAIDETREDFNRLPWGPGKHITLEQEFAGIKRFEQMWFAGNHSDIGGSYPEAESRLSDIALKWMVEEATKTPDGLRVAGQRMPGVVNGIPQLHLYPAPDGVQHCEIAGMKDTLTKLPAPLRRFLNGRGWAMKVRTIDPKAPVHQSVAERFELPEVPQVDGMGPYRPAALTDHEAFKKYYLAVDLMPSAEGGSSSVV